MPRKVAKICPKLTKTSKRHDKHCCQTDICVQSCRFINIENVRRRKKVHNKCKSKKYSSQIQHPVTDLKMESFAKIVNGFKLKLFSQKSTILDVTQVLNLPLTTINKCF